MTKLYHLSPYDNEENLDIVKHIINKKKHQNQRADTSICSLT